MKQNLTLTVFYFLCNAIAIFLHPVRDNSGRLSNRYNAIIVKKSDKALVQQQTEILHGELMFKY